MIKKLTLIAAIISLICTSVHAAEADSGDVGVARGALVVTAALDAFATSLKNLPTGSPSFELGRVTAMKALIRGIERELHLLSINTSLQLSSDVRIVFTPSVIKLRILARGNRFTNPSQLGAQLQSVAAELRRKLEIVANPKQSLWSKLTSKAAASSGRLHDLALSTMGRILTDSVVTLRISGASAGTSDPFQEAGTLLKNQEMSPDTASLESIDDFWKGVEATLKDYQDTVQSSKLELGKLFENPARGREFYSDVQIYLTALSNEPLKFKSAPDQVEIFIELEDGKLEVVGETDGHRPPSTIEKLQLLKSPTPICERALRFR